MMSRPFAATKTNNNNKTVPGGNVTFYLYILRSGIYIVASGARAIAAGRETRKRNTRCTHARTSPINVCSSQILRIFLSEGLKKKNNLQQLAGGGRVIAAARLPGIWRAIRFMYGRLCGTSPAGYLKK